MNSKLNVPNSVGPGVTVKVFVAELKLIKMGKTEVLYSITDTD